MPNLKIFQNDTFWQNRFQRRHTKHQKVLRPKNKTWKELSLHLGYFNWCPSDWFSILGMSDCLKKQLLLAVEDFFQENARIWQQGLMASIRKKDIDLIEFFIWKGARCWNDAMNASAAVGDQVLVRFFIDHGANDFIEAAEVARKHGHLELAKEILAIKYTEYHI